MSEATALPEFDPIALPEIETAKQVDEALTIEERELLLTSRLTELAQARVGLETARKYLADTKAIYGIDDLEKSVEDLSKMVSESTHDVREYALDLFSKTLQKNLIHGIKIRQGMSLTYDNFLALAYCQQYAPKLVMFDKRGFDKLARALVDASQGIDFVKTAVTFEATIPTDLSGMLVVNPQVMLVPEELASELLPSPPSAPMPFGTIVVPKEERDAPTGD